MDKYSKTYYAQNRDTILLKHKEYRINNKDKIKEYYILNKYIISNKNKVNYNDGKIYILSNKDYFYIGSTALKTLTIRHQKHISKQKYLLKYKKQLNKLHLYLDDTFNIELLYYYKCNNRLELEREEQSVINLYLCDKKCLNMR